MGVVLTDVRIDGLAVTSGFGAATKSENHVWAWVWQDDVRNEMKYLTRPTGAIISPLKAAFGTACAWYLREFPAAHSTVFACRDHPNA